MATLHAVLYTATNGMDTEHSVWPTYERAVQAGGELARRVWAAQFPGEPVPDGTDDEQMDAVRGALQVHLEVEAVDAPWLAQPSGGDEPDPVTVLAGRATEMGKTERDLERLVLLVSSLLAHEVTNGGFFAQIRFLIDHLGLGAAGAVDSDGSSLMDYYQLYPEGRNLFYEGDQPGQFVEDVRMELGFDPSEHPLFDEAGGWQFHCPALKLPVLYVGAQDGRWQFGS